MESTEIGKTKEVLVSIIIITYNSAKYVIETLDSANKQTWRNIELIVSDDCSTDNTVQICKQWFSEHQERFVRTIIITAEKNTGVAPNCNRGLYAAKGEWVKLIAGDDILLDDCIKTNVNASLNSNSLFFFSKCQILATSEERRIYFENWYESVYKYFKGNQLDNLMTFGYYFPQVTFFANLSEFKKLGFYNEKYPYHEDFPMWFTILKSGYSFYFIDQFTVLYRIHGNSIYTNMNEVVNVLWHKSTKRFYYNEFLKERIRRKQYLKAFDHVVKFLYLDLAIIAGNKPGFINKCCMVIRFLSPLYLMDYVRNFIKARIK